jgi:hypothetical protein
LVKPTNEGEAISNDRTDGCISVIYDDSIAGPQLDKYSIDVTNMEEQM